MSNILKWHKRDYLSTHLSSTNKLLQQNESYLQLSQLWVNSATALWEERLRESTLTENYLVLPGQVLHQKLRVG